MKLMSEPLPTTTPLATHPVDSTAVDEVENNHQHPKEQAQSMQLSSEPMVVHQHCPDSVWCVEPEIMCDQIVGTIICSDEDEREERAPTVESSSNQPRSAEDDAKKTNARDGSAGSAPRETFLGLDGQMWQKRGRFLVWPVSQP
jgi:hypothetical protein